MANRLDVSERTIAEMLNAGVVVLARDRWGNSIPARYDLAKSTVAYIRKLRTERGSNANKSPEQLEFERVRNQKAAAQAEQEELKLAQIRGEMHTTASILAVVGPQHVAFRRKMLAIPTKTARVLAAESDYLRVQKILTGEVKEALGELVGFPSKVSSRNGHGGRVRQSAKKRARKGDKRRKAR